MKAAGADSVVIANTEAANALAGGIFASLGVNASQMADMAGTLRDQMDRRAQSLVQDIGQEGSNISSDDDIFTLDTSLISTVNCDPTRVQHSHSPHGFHPQLSPSLRFGVSL